MQKSARMMDDKRVKQAIGACKNERETAMLLLSVRAGLRAVEIAGIKWGSVDLEDGLLLLKTTKGNRPRHVPIAKDLKAALEAYRATKDGKNSKDRLVFTNTHNRPGQPLTANAVACWFHDFYNRRLGWEGYSSHSGRRTFATKVARKIGEVGGSVRDVQKLLGHEWLSTTQRYIDVDPEAQKKVIDMI